MINDIAGVLGEIVQFFIDTYTIFCQSLSDFEGNLNTTLAQLDAISKGNYDGTIAVVLGNFRYIVGDAIYTGLWAMMIMAAFFTLYTAVVKFVDMLQKAKTSTGVTGWASKIPNIPKLP